ncbi:RNA polymerase II-associated factor 1-like protein [Aphelenchoides fujianensis]|nr:RNA polymerase II-associated factor 1-like protein [Aphelenchoides fujianensis]
MSRNRPPAALFVCKKRTYTNTLTTSDVACPPKFANLWFHTVERYGECRLNSLTAETKFEVWPEDILTNCPSLIDLSIYERGPDVPINEKDAILMEDDSAPNPNTKRSQQHSKIVPWMRKTEYISTEFSRFGVSSDRSENKIGYSIKKRYGNQENFYKDEASQIEAIKKIFEDTKKPVRRHHSKKNVVAVEEIPILPDADQWKFEYAQMNFDNEPVPPPEAPNQQQLRDHEVSSFLFFSHPASFRGMADTEGRQFVGYFVPTPETYKQLEEDKAEGRTAHRGLRVSSQSFN